MNTMKTQTFEEKIMRIKMAVRYGVAIVLEDYYSENSQTIGSRKVLPLKIKGDCVLCLDLDKGSAWGQYKFERIQGNIYAL